MQDANLLIIHQGALGDFILTFPAVIRLRKYYKSIDVLCQSQPGKLAKALGIAENWYPAEAAYVASLFSNQIDPLLNVLLLQQLKPKYNSPRLNRIQNFRRIITTHNKKCYYLDIKIE